MTAGVFLIAYVLVSGETSRVLFHLLAEALVSFSDIGLLLFSFVYRFLDQARHAKARSWLCVKIEASWSPNPMKLFDL